MRALASQFSGATVSCIDPLGDSRWPLALAHEDAGLFHSPPWLRTLAESYGFRVRALIVTDSDSALVGGLPFCELDDCIGRRLVSLPFSDVCDPLITSPAAWELLRSELESRGVPFELKAVRTLLTAGDRGEVARSARYQRLNIDGSSHDLWCRLAGQARRAVRKAERVGLDIRPLENETELLAFHRMHLALRRRKYGLLGQPFPFFEVLARRFSEADGWFPLGAFHDGRLVAATIYLRWRDVLYYKFNASEPDALMVRPNNALLWAGIELAWSLGCRTLDLGLTPTHQAGLLRFKRSFGALEHGLWSYRWSPRGWSMASTLASRDRLETLARRCVSPDVSDESVVRASARLYRLFA